MIFPTIWDIQKLKKYTPGSPLRPTTKLLLEHPPPQSLLAPDSDVSFSSEFVWHSWHFHWPSWLHVGRHQACIVHRSDSTSIHQGKREEWPAIEHLVHVLGKEVTVYRKETFLAGKRRSTPLLVNFISCHRRCAASHDRNYCEICVVASFECCCLLSSALLDKKFSTNCFP